MFKKYLLVGLFLFWVLLSPISLVAQENIFTSAEIVSSCDGVMVTELVPYPSEGTEWTEIYNTNDYDINVKGCFISDISSGTHFYEIKENLIVRSKEYHPYYSETSLSLNNTPGDGIRFLDKDKKTIKFETPKYDTVEGGHSFAYDISSNNWKWTASLTPGSTNIFDIDIPTPKNEGDEEIDTTEDSTYNSCQGIMITEIMPSPEGSDVENEWIEVYNSNSTLSNLAGCILSDKLKAGSTNKYIMPQDTQLTAGGYLKFMRPVTKITLNNDSDGVVLLDSKGVVVFDTGLYTNTQEGASYAYHDGQWFWTSSPTPGEPNVITEPLLKKSKNANSTKKKTAAKPPKSTKASAKKNSKKDSAVLGANSGDDASRGKVNDRMMGYILVGLSAVLLVGYVVWINKDFIYENTIKKLRRNS